MSRDDADIERVARQFRKKLGIDDQLRPDMTTVIIKLKDHGLIKNYVRVPDHEMPDDEACFDSEDKLLYIRESKFCAASAMYTYRETERRRARFTIAHEIGHIALGHKVFVIAEQPAPTRRSSAESSVVANVTRSALPRHFLLPNIWLERGTL
jgi:hypothetical protein